MELRHPFRRFAGKGSTRAWATTLLVPAVAGGILMSFSESQRAKAQSGYSYLQAKIQDTGASHAFGVLDAHDASGMLTGFIQVNQPSSSPSQLWEVTLEGATDFIHLKNKGTGLCIGDASGKTSATVTLRACSDPETVWQRIPHGGGTVFLRTTETFGFYPDIKVCVGKDRSDPGLAYTLGCTGDHFGDEMVWQATLQPIGTSSSGLTPPPPPPVPPSKPTACKLIGSAVCGLVGFSCDPLSASDNIVVPSGTIGVKVTGVQPQIGLITASYLNQGNASVPVCAQKSGMAVCGDPINISFGPTFCTGPAPTHICPIGQSLCRGACRPPTDPECFIK
jgi:hypothetical protein